MRIRKVYLNDLLNNYCDFYLSQNEISDLMVYESTLWEINELVWMEIRIPIVHESQIRHIKTTASKEQRKKTNSWSAVQQEILQVNKTTR